MQLQLRGIQSKHYLLRSGSKAPCSGWLYWYLSYYARHVLKRYEIRRDLSNLQQRHFRYPKLHLKRREKLKKVKTYVEIQMFFPLFLHAVWTLCLPSLPRIQMSLSRWEFCPQRKAGRKKRARPRSIAIRHQSLAFRTRLCAKYEVPEEEAAPLTFHFAKSPLENLLIG